MLWNTNMWSFCSLCLRFNHPPVPLHICQPLSWIRKSMWFSSWTYGFSCPMSDMTCITSFLETSSFPVSLVTTISYTYFICLSNGNPFCLRRNSSLYVIGLLPIFCKQLDTGIWGTGYLPNYKQSSSHTPLTTVFLRFSRASIILGQFYFFHHEFLFWFAAGYSFYVVTLVVSCSAELLAPDSMGVNYPKPTTNFSRTVTLVCFLWSSRLDVVTSGTKSTWNWEN